MSSCERCWSMAYDPYSSQSERYQENIATHTCTPEQQAGEGAGECPECHRMTKHQHTDELMCGCTHDPVRNVELQRIAHQQATVNYVMDDFFRRISS